MGLLRRARRGPRYEPRHALEERTRRDPTLVALLVVLLSSAGFVAGTTATFSGSVSTRDNVFATAALKAPTNPALEMRGRTVRFSWLTVNDADNEGAGYRISWKDAGAPTDIGGSPTCAATPTSYYEVEDPDQNSSLGGLVGDTGTTPYDDASVDSRAGNRSGRFICYRVQTLYPYPATSSPWLSQGSLVEKDVQTGFVVNSVQLTESGAVGGLNSLNTGDKLTIRFNQTVSTTSGLINGTETICAGWNYDAGSDDRILIGSTTTGNTLCCPFVSTTQGCAAAETVRIARLSDASDPLPAYRIGSPARYEATWAWSECSDAPTNTKCSVLTATLGARVHTSTGGDPSVQNSNPWYVTPTSNLLSGEDNTLAVCTSNPSGGLCVPKTTGNF